jgi:hypothetical protein
MDDSTPPSDFEAQLRKSTLAAEDAIDRIDLSPVRLGSRYNEALDFMRKSKMSDLKKMSTDMIKIVDNEVVNSFTKTEETKESVEDQDSFCSLFLIYGLNHLKYIKDRNKTCEILSSYPDLNQNPSVVHDNNYISSLDIICFPKSKSNVESFTLEYLMPENTEKLRDKFKPSYFHFISTNAMADKKYLTSMSFKEILLSDHGAWIIPKAILVASKYPIFSLQRQLLEHIYAKVVVRNLDVSMRVFVETADDLQGIQCMRLPDGQPVNCGAHYH